MIFFRLTERQDSVPQSQIFKIIFGGCPNVLTSFDIVSLCFANDESILEVLNILGDGMS